MATSDRRPYQTATTLDQDLLDEMQDNLENALEMVADIETPDGTIRASDRNKYVGSVFYKAITQFPVIKRTVGEWLQPTVEFSRLELSLGNVDSSFNKYLPGGADFNGWIGKEVEVRMGLRDASSTYETLYLGTVTEVAGLQRDRSRIKILSRDRLDKINVDIPQTALTKDVWTDLEDAYVGTFLPIIYGDWTTALPKANDPPVTIASIPAIPVNGAKADVLAGNENVRCLISENNNSTFDTSNVWLKRGDTFWLFDAADIVTVFDGKDFRVRQSGTSGTTTVDGGPYVFQAGDTFVVRVAGKSLSGFNDNLIWQARDLLLTYGGAVSGDLAANWQTYRDKVSPVESATGTFKSRVYIKDPIKVMEYVRSMLSQVRLEMFIDRDLKFRLLSLHLDDLIPSPAHSIKNWDIQADSAAPSLQEQNLFNRANGFYSYDPSLKENSLYTPPYRNQAAITQAGKAISKTLVFPNLYRIQDVTENLREILKIASAYIEVIDVTLTPRALKRDIGDFVSLDLDFASLRYDGVPALIREIGYDPNGLRIPVRLWSFQMLPFPGYTPGYDGTVGGSSATITQE